MELVGREDIRKRCKASRQQGGVGSSIKRMFSQYAVWWGSLSLGRAEGALAFAKEDEDHMFPSVGQQGSGSVLPSVARRPYESRRSERINPPAPRRLVLTSCGEGGFSSIFLYERGTPSAKLERRERENNAAPGITDKLYKMSTCPCIPVRGGDQPNGCSFF